MTDTTHPTDRELFRFANGIVLEDGDDAKVATHLATCPPCSERVAALRGAVPRQPELPLPPHLLARIEEQVARPPRRGPPYVLLFAVLVAALIGLAVLPRGGSPPPEAPSTGSPDSEFEDPLPPPHKGLVTAGGHGDADDGTATPDSRSR